MMMKVDPNESLGATMADYYKAGENGMIKMDSGVAYYLDENNRWRFDGGILDMFMSVEPPEKFSTLEEAKKHYATITKNKAWAP
jgi:hypothetical protein